MRVRVKNKTVEMQKLPLSYEAAESCCNEQEMCVYAEEEWRYSNEEDRRSRRDTTLLPRDGCCPTSTHMKNPHYILHSNISHSLLEHE